MKSILKNYKYRILSTLIITTIAYFSFGYPTNHFYLTLFILALCNSILLQSILLPISKYRLFYYPISFIIACVMSLEISHIAIFSSRLSFSAIASIIETNEEESLSMVKALKEYIPLFTIVILIASTIFEIQRREQIKKEIKKRYIIYAFLISCLLVTTKSYRGITLNKYSFVLRNEIYDSPLLGISNYCLVWTPVFINTSAIFTSYLYELYKFKQSSNIEQDLPSYIYLNREEVTESPKVIFIVIGESSNRENYSLFGYTTQTTPYLDSLSFSNKLLYYKTVSPASVTRDAVPFVLTFGTPLNPEFQQSYKSVIELAKDQGYEVFWISSQSKIGTDEGQIGRIASKSDFIQFSEFKNDDLDVINEVKKKYSTKNKQLFVLHLRGSHQSYKNGYDSIDENQINASTTSTTNFENIDYDRSIHHTNRFLAELYESFFKEGIRNDNDKNILFYTSDHGEIVNVGHGAANYNMSQYKIPFIVFGSTYFTQVDHVINKYMNNNIFNSSNFPYLFAEIIGYKVDPKQTEKAKKEGMYYKRADRKILNFPSNMD